MAQQRKTLSPHCCDTPQSAAKARLHSQPTRLPSPVRVGMCAAPSTAFKTCQLTHRDQVITHLLFCFPYVSCCLSRFIVFIYVSVTHASWAYACCILTVPPPIISHAMIRSLISNYYMPLLQRNSAVLFYLHQSQGGHHTNVHTCASATTSTTPVH